MGKMKLFTVLVAAGISWIVPVIPAYCQKDLSGQKRSEILPTVPVIVSDASGQRPIEIFTRMDGIPGESLDPTHREWIVTLGYNEDIMNAAAFASGGAKSVPETPHFSFELYKYIDKSSPSLRLAAILNTPIREVVIEFRKQGAQPYVFQRITLRDVKVKEVSARITTSEHIEVVVLGFRRIEWLYTPLDAKGRPLPPTFRCFDLSRNAPCRTD